MRVLVRSTDGRDHLEDLRIDGRIIFKWFFKKRYGEALTGLVWLWIETGGRHL